MSVNSDLVYLPENTSCTRNPKIALNYALSNPKSAHVPVLFSINCVNYKPPIGTNLNNEAYSAYPSEEEYILMEGSFVFILSVERD